MYCTSSSAHLLPLTTFNVVAYSWIEHDPEEIWQGVLECIEQAFQAAQQKHGRIIVKALGITNQRETTVVWDKVTGRPLHNAIVWMDSRTERLCEQYPQKFGSKASLLDLCSTCILLASNQAVH